MRSHWHTDSDCYICQQDNEQSERIVQSVKKAVRELSWCYCSVNSWDIGPHPRKLTCNTDEQLKFDDYIHVQVLAMGGE